LKIHELPAKAPKRNMVSLVTIGGYVQ